ncbi:MAG TPA: hypothetical protein QGF08_07005 [Candidatus Marinimicrobia bacterium]|jgi:hypothetical protein|nr:hypothetical protein [Candidatus Neomarinimicrobiota bacterium]MDP7437231.1 hypothetical protein [Candidatus Neomarinimicrobiota bacterium]HJL74875.1 hypothetical protein [Candidatus Neomarinimicrobiota bacterium]HJM70615.1 hypothetical protein [Candidatus Neomarinimicrobiota bacterium]|tara:strand:+ start:2994 stop:3980 length:987 start_codon:yes stop_codon:yes gene_type:complete
MNTSINIKHSVFFFALIGILFTGCVETIINVRVHPDGRYTMGFTTKGDSTDVFNNDFPHPSGPDWTTHVSKEKKEKDDIWTMSTQGIIAGSYIFTSRKDSLVALQHPIQVERKEGYFATRYTLRNVFVGRQVYRKYPAFGQSLQESDSDSTRWLDEAFNYMCSQAINNLQNDPATSIEEGLAERVENHIRNTLARVSQKELFNELENKQAFIDQTLRPFSRDLPLGYGTLLSKATDAYAEELRLTNDLQDDQFEYRVIMPGMISFTNADTISGDTLKWSFGLQQYLNDDHVVSAASVVYSARRIQVAVLITAGLFLVILYLAYKRGQK